MTEGREAAGRTPSRPTAKPGSPVAPKPAPATAPGEALGRGDKRWTRAVLHVDMDAFYVAVELLRRPKLRGRPVVVGGAGRRGVVAAASYEARAYGVHSAMPSVVARRLCPQAVFLPGDHQRYAEVSRGVMEIFARVTPLVEPMSLDEAFLEVTGAQRRMGPPPVIAAEIRRLVADEQGLICSVGVATTKFLAKLASEAAKPSASPRGPVPGVGVQVVWPGRELEFLHPLALTDLWGVGPATLARLERLGVATVGALAALPQEAVVAAVGDAVGRHLWALAQGRDEREVVPDRPPRSIGHEETFAFDLVSREDCHRELIRLADAVAARLRHHGHAGRTITLKLRFGDFRTITRARTLPAAVDSAPVVVHEARALLDVEDISTGVRLLGISMSGLTSSTSVRQLSFDELLDAEGNPARSGSGWAEAERAVDAIRSRFGDRAIGPGALATGSGVRTLRRGAQAWGPDGDRPPAPDHPGGGARPEGERAGQPRR